MRSQFTGRRMQLPTKECSKQRPSHHSQLCSESLVFVKAMELITADFPAPVYDPVFIYSVSTATFLGLRVQL